MTRAAICVACVVVVDRGLDATAGPRIVVRAAQSPGHRSNSRLVWKSSLNNNLTTAVTAAEMDKAAHAND